MTWTYAGPLRGEAAVPLHFSLEPSTSEDQEFGKNDMNLFEVTIYISVSSQ